MFRAPLIDDELLSRRTATAKVELTESDLVFISTALAEAAKKAPGVWHGSEPLFKNLSTRFARVLSDLRTEVRNHNAIGAATAATATAPHTQQEVDS